MVKLWAIYVITSTALALVFGVVAANYGGPVWVAGFLPPAILGVAAAGKAFRLGQEAERETLGGD